MIKIGQHAMSIGYTEDVALSVAMHDGKNQVLQLIFMHAYAYMQISSYIAT